jgi:hypothetical protein
MSQAAAIGQRGGSNFTQKLLRTTFSLGAGNKSGTTFGQTGNNTVTLDGLRTSALIHYVKTGWLTNASATRSCRSCSSRSSRHIQRRPRSSVTSPA